MSDVLKISVTHIGPHEGRAIDVLPGVSVLAGPCGAGKTSFLNAVGASVGLGHRPTATYLRESPGPRLVGGKGRRPPTGQVTLPGVGGDAGATVSPSGRVSRFGVPAVDVVHCEDFVLFTRPDGAKDTEEKRRLKGFSGLTGVKASVSDLVDPVFAGAPWLSTIPAGGSLVDMGEAVNKALYSWRRKLLSTDLPEAEGRVSVLRAQYGDGTVAGALSVVDAQAAFTAAEQAYRSAVASAAARRQMEATQARLREGRGPRPDVEASKKAVDERVEVAFGADAQLSAHLATQPADVNIDALVANVTAFASRCLNESGEINRLEAALAALRASHARTTRDLADAEQALSEGRSAAIVRGEWESARVRYEADATTANDRLSDAEKADRDVAIAAQRWDDAEAELSRPIEGATPEDVAAAEAVLNAARSALTEAEVSERRASVAVSLREAEAKVNDLKAMVDTLEEAATTGVQTRMRKLLESSGAAGWAVVDGVVYATHPRHGDLVPVSSLSTGELDRLALGLLLSKQEKKQGGYTLLLLDQDVGNGLDAPTLTALGDLAREHGVYILTGATRDLPELTVIHY